MSTNINVLGCIWSFGWLIVGTAWYHFMIQNISNTLGFEYQVAYLIIFVIIAGFPTLLLFSDKFVTKFKFGTVKVDKK